MGAAGSQGWGLLLLPCLDNEGVEWMVVDSEVACVPPGWLVTAVLFGVRIPTACLLLRLLLLPSGCYRLD